jgi:hypothetical protein
VQWRRGGGQFLFLMKIQICYRPIRLGLFMSLWSQCRFRKAVSVGGVVRAFQFVGSSLMHRGDFNVTCFPNERVGATRLTSAI